MRLYYGVDVERSGRDCASGRAPSGMSNLHKKLFEWCIFSTTASDTGTASNINNKPQPLTGKARKN
jgi:hypothetical protein